MEPERHDIAFLSSGVLRMRTSVLGEILSLQQATGAGPKA